MVSSSLNYTTTVGVKINWNPQRSTSAKTLTRGTKEDTRTEHSHAHVFVLAR